ncbi:MAG TPA: hypothetical protein DDX33_07355 [Rikenellaceae bacterium]|nr:hypothetical protein [Rikenellaceae bacterium]HBH21743.1 hypothetical protein [Rikenellaceae bacterium]
MKTGKSILFAAAAVLLASCADKAEVNGILDGAADSQVIVKQLDVNRFTILDTIKTNGTGAFSYSLEVKKGQPEFVYLFYKDTRIAALLLEKGEHATVKADTLGNYSVEGSEGSAKLSEIDKEYVSFIKSMDAAIGNGPEMGKIYLQHYRNSVKYVLANSHSLTAIPVLYEQMSEYTPIFNQPSDALIFKAVSDSLSTVYPESRYVKALQKETERRMGLFSLDQQIKSAPEVSFPDINLQDINGQKKALSTVEDKAILVHFWTADNVAQKMLNIETLIPIYEKYHNRGFEVYAVCLSQDKAQWGSIVQSQKLPWINVCDTRGAASPAAAAYNVASLPTSILIVNGEIYNQPINGTDALKKILDKELR